MVLPVLCTGLARIKDCLAFTPSKSLNFQLRAYFFVCKSLFRYIDVNTLLTARSARGLVLHVVIVVVGREALVGRVVHTLAVALAVATSIAVASVDLDRP